MASTKSRSLLAEPFSFDRIKRSRTEDGSSLKFGIVTDIGRASWVARKKSLAPPNKARLTHSTPHLPGRYQRKSLRVLRTKPFASADCFLPPPMPRNYRGQVEQFWTQRSGRSRRLVPIATGCVQERKVRNRVEWS